MDLAELAERSNFDRRKLRYVLDHALVPELHIEIKDDELGRPRHFAPDVGFGILCAAHLQEAGLPHDTIRGFLLALLEIRFDQTDHQPALAYVLQRRKLPTYADWGDNEYACLRVEDWSSGWRRTGSRKPDKNIDPVFIITLNLGHIRDLVID